MLIDTLGTIKNYAILALVVIALGLAGQNWVLTKHNRQLSAEIAITQQSLIACKDNNEKVKADSKSKEDTLISLEEDRSRIKEDFEDIKKEFDKFKRKKCNVNSTSNNGGNGNAEAISNSLANDELSDLARVLSVATCRANHDCKPSEAPSSAL